MNDNKAYLPGEPSEPVTSSVIGQRILECLQSGVTDFDALYRNDVRHLAIALGVATVEPGVGYRCGGYDTRERMSHDAIAAMFSAVRAELTERGIL